MRLAIAALAFLSAAACGSPVTRPSGEGSPAGSAPAVRPPSSTAASSTRSPWPETPRSPSRNRGSTPGPAPLGRSAGGRVVLGRTCVHRGDPSEQQTLTVTASPGETVTYSTYYSDFSTELSRPDYTTGHGYGQAGTDGRFRAAWTVPAAATPGRATVRVTATDMTEDAQEASFVVAKQGDRCP